MPLKSFSLCWFIGMSREDSRRWEKVEEDKSACDQNTDQLLPEWLWSGEARMWSSGVWIARLSSSDLPGGRGHQNCPGNLGRLWDQVHGLLSLAEGYGRTSEELRTQKYTAGKTKSDRKIQGRICIWSLVMHSKINSILIAFSLFFFLNYVDLMIIVYR